MKRFFSFLTAALVVSVTLAACGDNTAAPAGTGSGAVAGATPAATANMPGMTMAPGTTTSAASATTAMVTTAAAAGTTSAATTAAPTTAAAAGTTAAMATTMAGTTMAPGTTMPGMSMAPGTTAAASGAQPTPGNDAMTQSLKALSGAEFETKFMQQMIAHHMSAIDMAKLVPTNTKRPELLKLSQDIISAQDKEISDMTGWLASWYSAKPLADMMSAPGMMDMMGQMDKLKAARDAEFDKMFLSMMIEHHSNAVSMASLVPQKTQRPELLKLSQDIIKSQSVEIEQMKSWQKTWFPA